MMGGDGRPRTVVLPPEGGEGPCWSAVGGDGMRKWADGGEGPRPAALLGCPARGYRDVPPDRPPSLMLCGVQGMAVEAPGGKKSG